MEATISIGTKTFSATFADNSAARSVYAFFPLQLSMSEWAGNSEYYARLPAQVSADGKPPKAFSAGDVALYNGISLVIFYAATANTSGYTLLGHIADSDALKSALDTAKGNVTFARADKAEAGDEAQIKNLYREMYRAMIAKDMAEMERIHAESFVLVHMTGTKMNKREYLAAVKDGTLNYYTADHDDIAVSVSGKRATVCGKSRVSAAVYGGGRHKWRLQQDMTAEKIGGAWQFTHSTASTY